MREIKFRAWNLTEKKWNKVSEVFGIDDYFKELESGIIRFNRGDVILQQFTGLLDKNGKEIYEGDILKGTYIFEVRFEKGGFHCFAHNNLSNRHKYPLSNNHSGVKIIGNIFENK